MEGVQTIKLPEDPERDLRDSLSRIFYGSDHGKMDSIFSVEGLKTFDIMNMYDFVDRVVFPAEVDVSLDGEAYKSTDALKKSFIDNGEWQSDDSEVRKSNRLKVLRKFFEVAGIKEIVGVTSGCDGQNGEECLDTILKYMAGKLAHKK